MQRQIVTRVVLLVFLLVVAGTGTAVASASSEPRQSTTYDRYRLEGVVTSPCTGNEVSYAGDVVVRTHSITDGAGVVRTSVHRQYSLVGVEAGTGTTYRVHEAFQNTYTSGGSGAGLETYINNLHFLAQGSGNNFFYVEKYHFTRNANGEITAYHEVFDLQCR